MNTNNVVGIIYANVHDDFIPLLTKKRSMASVPFGSRYRLVDFHLSNLVNAGINKIGLITNSNYHSLMDHVGSGRYWDLDRKRGGLKVLPPFNNAAAGVYTSHIEALSGAMTFLRGCKEEYLILCDSDVVGNFDLTKATAQHIASGADITYLYAKGNLPKNNCDIAIFEMDDNSRVKKMNFAHQAQDVCYCLDITIIRRKLLMELVEKAVENGYSGMTRDIIAPALDKFKVYGYAAEGFVRVIDSMEAYIEANMSLLNADARADLFCGEHLVFTKTRDDMPTRYGINAKVSNSLIADGCIIKGNVKNCIIFRGVTVEEGSTVENCILMQDTKIGQDCSLNFVLADKRVKIRDNSHISGSQSDYRVLEKEQNI